MLILKLSKEQQLESSTMACADVLVATTYFDTDWSLSCIFSFGRCFPFTSLYPLTVGWRIICFHIETSMQNLGCTNFDTVQHEKEFRNKAGRFEQFDDAATTPAWAKIYRLCHVLWLDQTSSRKLFSIITTNITISHKSSSKLDMKKFAMRKCCWIPQCQILW